MAKKTETIVTLTDDLDGATADRTVTFSYEGTSYEIDLSKRNATAFDKAMASYIGAARKVRPARGRTSAGSRAKGRTDLAQVREWAQSNGYEVSARGRIAQSIQDAYDAAH